MKKNRNCIRSIAFAAAAFLLIAEIFPINSYADGDNGSGTSYISETNENDGGSRNAGNTDIVNSDTSGAPGDTVILGTTGENGTDEGPGTPGGTDTPENTGTPEVTDTPSGTGAPEGPGTSVGTGTPEETGNPEGTGIPGGTDVSDDAGIPGDTGTSGDTASGGDPAEEGGATGRGEAQESGNTGTVPEIVCMFNEACTRFELILCGYEPAEGGSLRAAIWSEAGGQDDLEWVGLTKQDDGTYKKTVNISDFSDPGKLDIHVYKTGTDGTASYVTGADVDVPTVTAGNLVLVSGMSDGSAVISSEWVSCASGITSARAAAWSKADQSDLYWYDMQEDGSGNWTFTLNLKKHKNNTAIFNVHMYALDGNGFTRYAAGNTFDFRGLTGNILVTVDPFAGTYTTEITGFSSASVFREIRAAVWTDTGGQDDISWHVLNASEEGDYASVTSSASDFKHFGTAYAHAYVTMSDGSAIFLDGCKFSLDAPTSDKLTAVPSDDGSFTLTLPGLQSVFPVKEVRMAVWSAADQSNLYWYTAEKAGTDYVVKGNVSNHKNMSGVYYVHVYAFFANAPATFVSGTTMEIAAASGKISFRDNGLGIPGNGEKSYRLSISDISAPFAVSRIQFAVWNTAATGNIRWYTAVKASDGSYYADVPISDFKKLGQYVTHVYVTYSNGNMSYLNGSLIMNVTGITGAAIKSVNDDSARGTFEAYVTGATAPSGIESMIFYVWTTPGQTDMHAYTGILQSDGSYKVKVDIANHGYHTGRFYIHAHAVIGNGITLFAAGIERTFITQNVEWLDNGFNYLAIGNSITWYGITGSWWNEVGQAASDADHDYFHIVLNRLRSVNGNAMGVPYNFVAWEVLSHDRDEVLRYLDHYLNSNLDLVTVELAENVSDLSTYQKDYESLLRYIQAKAPNARILVVDDYWTLYNRAELKKAAVENTGVEFVSLDGIKDNPAYHCGIGTVVYDAYGNAHVVDDANVAVHPGNVGMAAIAGRIIEVIGE